MDGVIVAHSHAIKGEGGAVPHQHSSNSEIFQYHFLSHFAVSDGVVHVLTLRFIFSLLACLTSVPVAPGYFLSVERCLSLRAPPVI